MVSKRKDSAYRSGRSPDWLKIKNLACEAVRREAEGIGDADWAGIQCGLTQHVGVALAGLRQLDDPCGDCFIGKVGSACISNSCREPGLIAYECPSCNYVTSMFWQPKDPR
jgi:hypothetical protein